MTILPTYISIGDLTRRGLSSPLRPTGEPGVWHHHIRGTDITETVYDPQAGWRLTGDLIKQLVRGLPRGLGQTTPTANRPTIRRDVSECAPWTLPHNDPGASRTAPPLSCLSCPPGTVPDRFGVAVATCVPDNVAHGLYRNARNATVSAALAYMRFVSSLPGVEQWMGRSWTRSFLVMGIAFGVPTAAAVGGAYHLYKRRKRTT